MVGPGLRIQAQIPIKMWTQGLLTFAGFVTAFSAADRALSAFSFQNPYYLIHALHNAAIINLTVGDTIMTIVDFDKLHMYAPNFQAALLVAALHTYHILLYWKKLRLDDWLHHLLMIFVALPIGVIAQSSTLLGFSLFFSTGLPGCIDYSLLFAVRNGWFPRSMEKRVNRWLNVWIRSPGCVAHAALSLVYILGNHHQDDLMTAVALLPVALMYWNGQYFMQQVVADEERERLELQVRAPV
jgi:hypothetical protein